MVNFLIANVMDLQQLSTLFLIENNYRPIDVAENFVSLWSELLFYEDRNRENA